MLTRFFRRLLLALNNKVANTLPDDVVQERINRNWIRCWDAWNPHENTPKRAVAVDRFFETYFVPIVGAESCLLDLGCANACFSLPLASRCRHVYGFDLSPSFIQAARETAREQGLSNVTFEERDLLEWSKHPDGIPGIERQLETGEAADWPVTHILLTGVLTCFASNEDAVRLIDLCEKLLPRNGCFFLKDSVAPEGESRFIYTSSDGYMSIHRPVAEYRSMVENTGLVVEQEEFFDGGDEKCHNIFLLRKP